MRGEENIAELCRREGLNQNVYYRWSKEFLEAGKQTVPTFVSSVGEGITGPQYWMMTPVISWPGS